MATETQRASSFLKAGTCTTFRPSKISGASRKSRLCFSRFFCSFASSHSNIALYIQFVYTCQEGLAGTGQPVQVIGPCLHHLPSFAKATDVEKRIKEAATTTRIPQFVIKSMIVKGALSPHLDGEHDRFIIETGLPNIVGEIPVKSHRTKSTIPFSKP
jgi:hypothetical protein